MLFEVRLGTPFHQTPDADSARISHQFTAEDAKNAESFTGCVEQPCHISGTKCKHCRSGPMSETLFNSNSSVPSVSSVVKNPG